MNQEIVKKLKEFADETESIQNEVWADRWSSRVKAFLSAALGADEAASFLSVYGHDAYSTLAIRRGHLEGLAAREENANVTTNASTPEPRPEQIPSSSQKIFIVHGHDDAAKESTARFMEKIGLQPIILHEQPSGGRTIIEKVETYSKDVAFAVVLLTPDDKGYKGSDASNAKPRARQNVILELGFFIGKLGRTRVCALVKGDIERPTDYQGVVYVDMDSGGAWKTKLAQELLSAKITINLSGLV